MTSVFLDINSGDNQNETIDRLVDLKRNKSKLLQEEIDRNKQKLFALEDLKKKVQVLETVTKSLYDPFGKVKDFFFISSDESIISGKATPRAVEGSYAFEVLNLAQKQALQSRKIKSDLKIPQGKIKFKVDEEEITIKYSGGSPYDLARVLTKNSDNKLEASFIRISDEENYFIFQAKEGGEKNKIIVLEDDNRLLEKVGIFKKQPPIFRLLASYDSIAKEHSLTVTNNTVVINDKNKFFIPIEKKINFEKVESIFFQFKSEKNPNFKKNTPIAFIEFEKAGVVKKKPIPYKKNIKGYVVMNKYFLNSSIDPEVLIKNIVLVNQSTNNKFYYGKIFKIVRRPEDQRFLPEKIISKPTPSRFKFHTLIIERNSNFIDDFLDGVTLNLNKASNKKVEIQVKPKNNDLRQKMIDFINSFNLVIETVNIYSAPTLEELGVDKKQLTEDLQDKVGVLKGERTVIQLKEKLRNQLIKVYVISAKKKIVVSQLGLKYIFNFSRPYDIDVSKIEFEEDKFNNFAKVNAIDLVKLLGIDSNQDKVIDSGLGYEINQILANYLKPNTFFGLISSNLKRQNKTLSSSLDKEEERLNEYREELEFNFSKLERAKKEQEGLQNWFDSLKK